MRESINVVLANARNGDAEAALSILQEFRETIRNNRDSKGKPHRTPSGCGTQFDEKLLDYMAECLDRLSEGKTVRNERAIRITLDEAFHLTQPGKRGRKQKSNTRPESLLRGLKVWNTYKKATGNTDLPKADGRTMGKDIESAIDTVSKCEHCSSDTARKNYLLWRSLLMEFDPKSYGS